MKAISNVIASLLMLIITIALAGLAYAYIIGVFTSRISYTFSLLGGEMIAGYPVITLSNDGTNTITTINSITIDGKPVNFSVIPENDNTLVAYYPLDEGSGTVAKDFSGNGNDGTINDNEGDQWVDSKYGKALSFDGTDDYVNNPSLIGLSTSGLTFVFWSKQLGTRNFFMHPIGIFGGHRATIYVSPNSYRYSYKFSSINGINHEGFIGTFDGEWHLFAVSFDGTNIKCYVDGELKVTVNAIGSITGGDSSVFIGTTGNGIAPAGNWFNGIIDEVRIYNRALTEQEIKSIYQIGNPIPAGNIGRIKLYPSAVLSTGTHTVRVCLPGMCQKTYLYVR